MQANISKTLPEHSEHDFYFVDVSRWRSGKMKKGKRQSCSASRILTQFSLGGHLSIFQLQEYVLHMLQNLLTYLYDMVSLLLQKLISYPRNRYARNGHSLDLAYITHDIVVMSMPSLRWPETLYRNSLHKVRHFLDSEPSGRTDWRVFDLRAEGAGYEDADLGGRVRHFGFVDHHPPPFSLLPKLVDAMHEHLDSSAISAEESNPSIKALDVADGAPMAGAKPNDKLAVIHCKAGKGRSGLTTCSYLVAHRGYREEVARALFTERRMRKGFGEGVSIPSQRRYLRYVQKWIDNGRTYQPTRVRLDRLEVKNLRHGCVLAVKGFEDEGGNIVPLHHFDHATELERDDTDDVVILRPIHPIEVDSDVCISLERGKAYAHFWINAFFERGKPFQIDWDDVDGWRGTSFHGPFKAYDSLTLYFTEI
jgi:protein-tyrosine phosphatase